MNAPKYNEDNLKKCGPAPRIPTKNVDLTLLALIAVEVLAIVVILLDVFYWRLG